MVRSRGVLSGVYAGVIICFVLFCFVLFVFPAKLRTPLFRARSWHPLISLAGFQEHVAALPSSTFQGLGSFKRVQRSNCPTKVDLFQGSSTLPRLGYSNTLIQTIDFALQQVSNSCSPPSRANPSHQKGFLRSIACLSQNESSDSNRRISLIWSII